MSWMDSWSRPSKSSAIPPPLYLTVGPHETVPYCHTCGRVISSRKTHSNAQEVKYCSTRCRHNKPGALDRRIEDTFVALLSGASVEALKKEGKGSGIGDGEENAEENVLQLKDVSDAREKKHKKKGSKSMKGEPRVTVGCGTVEDIVFPRHQDPRKVYGRRKNRAARGIIDKPEDWRSVDMVDDVEASGKSTSIPAGASAASSVSTSNLPPELMSDEGTLTDSEDEDDAGRGGIALEHDQIREYGYGGGKVRPPQKESDVNGSIGGEKGWSERTEETNEMKEKRREGQRKADEREMVRRAARRGCAFGFVLPNGQKAKCEAVMKGVVVESSFAKGEWGIRWREKY